MWTDIAFWACSVVALECNAAAIAPNMGVIQAAYDREITSGSKLHDKNLKVLEANCADKRPDGRYLCQVTYMSKGDPTQRLYYDIIAVAPLADGWELKSGLCKR